MNILLTGATGYLGSNLLRALLEKNNSVVILKRSFSDTALIDGMLDYVRSYDIDNVSLRKPFFSLDHFDYVVHAATCYGRQNEELETIVSSNLTFPTELLEAAAGFSTSAFLNIDTILPKTTNNYSFFKKAFLEWARFYSSRSKTRLINVELDQFYGPGDDITKFPTFILRSCLSNAEEIHLTEGAQKRDFTFIDDIVQGILTILEYENEAGNGDSNYQLGSGELITVKEFVERCADLTDSSSKLLFGEVPYRENEVMESNIDLTNALKTGWRPEYDLTRGLIKTIEYERNFEEGPE